MVCWSAALQYNMGLTPALFWSWFSSSVVSFPFSVQASPGVRARGSTVDVGGGRGQGATRAPGQFRVCPADGRRARGSTAGQLELTNKDLIDIHSLMCVQTKLIHAAVAQARSVDACPLLLLLVCFLSFPP